MLADHTADSKGIQPWPGFDLDRAGLFGVLLFFVLSAFLLTYLFFIQPRENLAHPATWLNYVVRRIARIVPLYALVLVVMAWVEPDFGSADVANHLLLRDGQAHFWTIAVEVKYYFILPVVVVLSRLVFDGYWKSGVGASIAIATILYFIGGFLETVWSMNESVWLSDYLWVFLAGSGAGLLYATMVRRSWTLDRYSTWFDVVAIACLAAALIRIPSVYVIIFGGEKIGKLPGDLGVFAALWSIFLLCVLLGRGWIRRILATPLLRSLGLVSYSVYLWHPFVLDYAETLALPLAMRWAVFLGGTAAIATATYWLVERPLSKLSIPSTFRFGKGATSSAG